MSGKQLSDAELQGIAAQALNMAKRDLERGRFNFLLASYHESDQKKLHRMTTIESLIVQRLGVEWMNSGHTKDIGFGLLRMTVDLLPPDAMVIVTAANRFDPTEKFYQLPEIQRQQIVDAGHDRHHQLVKKGLFTLADVLCAIVQTPQRVCHYMQAIDSRGKFTGKPDTGYYDQSQFGGRIKMFGEEVSKSKV